MADNSINYLVYIHNSCQNMHKGFYFFKIYCLTGYMVLVDVILWALLWVCSTIQLYIQFSMTEQLIVKLRLEAKKVDSNFRQDRFIMKQCGMFYECYIALQDEKCNESDMDDSPTDDQLISVDNGTFESIDIQKGLFPTNVMCVIEKLLILMIPPKQRVILHSIH